MLSNYTFLRNVAYVYYHCTLKIDKQMKKLVLTIFTITLIKFGFAQTKEQPWSLGLNLGTADYMAPIQKDVFNSKNWKINPSGTLSRYLSPSFDITGRISYGDYVKHAEYQTNLSKYYFIRRGWHNYDLLLRYKFNNGKLLSEDARFYPFLTAGTGLNRINKQTHLEFPIGLGFVFKATDRLNLVLESNYKFPNNQDRVIGRMEYLYHSIGFNFIMGNGTPSKPVIADKDGDGVADAEDRCPDSFGTIDFAGCPDRDKDGIPDIDDRCPLDPGTLKFAGCPDRDNDGVPDNADRCPDVAGSTNNAGCPEEPKVETTPVPTPNNTASNPTTVPKTEMNEIPDNLVKRIFYLVYQYDLTAEHYQVLDTVISLLNTYPTLKIQIGGHTDISGGDKINFPLSTQRAEKVKRYFLSKGIASNRVFSLGYGSKYPLVPNDTPEHRARNRRTEIRFQK